MSADLSAAHNFWIERERERHFSLSDLYYDIFYQKINNIFHGVISREILNFWAQKTFKF